MDFRIVYGVVIAFLLIEIAIQRAKVNKIREYMGNMFDLTKKIVEQHERYKEMADRVSEYFKIVKDSNDRVDSRYDQMEDKMSNLMKVVNALMKTNKKQEEN